MIGQVISHYRVLETLGQGGMGVVYKAQDTRLDRFVALKFLPHHARQDEQTVARLLQEARTASSLNHPNICTIYDIGEQDGETFIAMECLEGASLNYLISGGQLDIEAVLRLAIEIAEGLDAAHSRGIIHRDIKPANVFITDTGRAKILDFGVAKITSTPAGQPAVYGPDDITTQGFDQTTDSGKVMGTIPYMSPEQARGKEVDTRTDLFSFGAVLYEMATGQLPFRGVTAAIVFDELLNRNPVPPTQLKPNLPPELDNIIHKALEKDRDLRYQHASEMRADLQRLKRNLETGRVTASSARAISSRPSARGLLSLRDFAPTSSRSPPCCCWQPQSAVTFGSGIRRNLLQRSTAPPSLCCPSPTPAKPKTRSTSPTDSPRSLLTTSRWFRE